MNSLKITLFLNELELILLLTAKWFQVLLSKRSSFICTQLIGSKICYIIQLFSLISVICLEPVK